MGCPVCWRDSVFSCHAAGAGPGGLISLAGPGRGREGLLSCQLDTTSAVVHRVVRVRPSSRLGNAAHRPPPYLQPMAQCCVRACHSILRSPPRDKCYHLWPIMQGQTDCTSLAAACAPAPPVPVQPAPAKVVLTSHLQELLTPVVPQPHLMGTIFQPLQCPSASPC